MYRQHASIYSKSGLGIPLSMFALLLAFFSFSIPLHAHDLPKSVAIDITGKVIDETGVAMPGVSIAVKGTTSGTVTDTEGNYKITVSDKNAVLIFSFIGYKTQEVPALSKTINVTLGPDEGVLDEVVVVAYGEVKRRDLTGSVGKANVEDMEKAPVAAFDQALGGRIAGVVVTSNDGQPGTSAQIAIRGSSVSQDASPLFVIDGFPMENMDINSINPKDIESLEVLKDASSIAIYGSRGSNGVILITTKRGKIGAPKISYDVSVGIQEDVNRVKMMSPYEFVKLQLELDSIVSTAAAPRNVAKTLYFGVADANGIRPKNLEDYRNTEGYDWQDLVLQQGSLVNHSLSVTGGSNDTRYALRGSLFDQKGLITNTGLKRYDGRITIDQKLRKDLKLGLTGSYSYTQSFGTTPSVSNSASVTQGMWQYRPVAGVGNQDLENALADSLALADFNAGTATSTLSDNIINPLKQAQNEYRQSVNKTGTLNLFLEYTFLKNFKLKLSGGYSTTTLDNEFFFNSSTQQGNLFKNAAGAIPNTLGIYGGYNNILNQNYVNENTLTYVNKINKNHKIEVLGGFTYQYGSSRQFSFRSVNIPQASEYLGVLSLVSGTANLPNTGGTHAQLYSLLSRVNYTYLGRYLFTASIRGDGSSKFTPGKQWGYFPSAAVAWQLGDEPFMKSIKKVMSSAKLRVGYGTVGNNKVGDFSYLSQYGNLNTGQGYAFNNNYNGGIVPFFYGNDNITWETATELNLGANLGFFKDRVTVEVDVYDKTSKNFLIGAVLPALAGYTVASNSQYQNTGRISNKGLEISVNTINVQTKDFTWSTNFNLGANRSKILEFYNGVTSRATPWNLIGNGTAWLAEVGGPITQFYGYVFDGVYQYADFDAKSNGTYLLKNGVVGYAPSNVAAPIQPGDPKYKDLNGDGIVDVADQTTLGSSLPIHTGGFSNNLTYKGLSLNAFFQWSYGNEVLNANKAIFEQGGPFGINQFDTYVNRWTPTNPSNELPRARATRGDANSTNIRPSSRYVEDGSFIRLKTVSLSYSLPRKLLAKAKISEFKLYASAQNLITWTNYTGIDPEASTYRTPNAAGSPLGGGAAGSSNFGGTGYSFIQPSSGYAVLAGGFDLTPYPRAKTYTVGVTVTF
jgi:TonB-dependent starch-binding outer membrane protein SusC